MNRLIWSVMAAIFIVGPVQALAAPNVVISSTNVGAGGTAVIDMTFEADGVVAGFDFEFTFDDTQFTGTPA